MPTRRSQHNTNEVATTRETREVFLLVVTMPPYNCPPQTDMPLNWSKDVAGIEAYAETESLKTTMPEEKILQPKTSGMFTISFHWKLNLYSAICLSLAFIFLPEQYRAYMTFFFGFVSMDAARYYYLKANLHGAPYTLPFVTIAAMLMAPEKFWAEMGEIAMASPEGLCNNQWVGVQLIFCTDPKKCREVFTGDGVYQFYVHPNSKWLFGVNNLVYLDGDAHKSIRRVLTPALFNSGALEYYAQCQEAVLRRYLDRFVKQCKEGNKPIDVRIAFRSMAAAASQESFLGPYLNDELRIRLEEDILDFTMGFLSPPIPFMFGLKRAIQAKHRIEKIIRLAVPKAKEYVLNGNPPRCLLERWAKSILEVAKEKGIEPNDVFGCSDHDVALTVMDFLFAAQDATNSALTYAADVLEAYPEVVEKMRAEVEAALGGKTGEIWKRLFAETNNMPYTKRVCNQLLHHKPPVPMLPHLTLKACQLGPHPIPKGVIVIPSIFYSAREAGSSADFLPDREDQDTQFMKGMTFGAGQHKCPGRRYAETQLTVFLAIVATGYRFERIGDRPSQDDFIYFPTLFPARNEHIIKSIG